MKKIFLSLLFFITSISVRAEETSHLPKKIPELILDLKTKDQTKRQIHVNIPPNFVVLTEMQDGNDKTYEFIPEGERPSRWSEIITVMQSPCYNKDLSQFVRLLVSGHVSRRERCTNSIVEENGIKVGYITAEMPAAIPNPDPNGQLIPIHGKKELLVMRIVEEMGGFSILQFSKRYDARFSREETGKLKESMIDYLKSCEIRLNQMQ